MIETILGWFWKILSLVRSVRVTSHVGELAVGNTPCCFVTVRNLSLTRKAVVTEVWFDAGIRIPVTNEQRPLPKVVPPEEIWETWIPLAALPESIRTAPETHARVKFSDEKIVATTLNRDISPAGHVPS